MESHTILAEHAAEPWSAIEADIDLSGLLDHHFKSPRLELLLYPSLGVSKSGGADRAASDVVCEMVLVNHYPVVGLADLDDFLYGFVLG